MEAVNGFCLYCEHKHRGVSQCNYCDCNWDNIQGDNTQEDNMIKKLIKWIWVIISWPFKKIHKWLIG